MSEYAITLMWERKTFDFVYETYDRTAVLKFNGGSSIEISNPPSYFGDANLPNAEELLISSLASCYMQTFLAVACKQGYIINSYADNVIGIVGKNASGKYCITEIILNPKILFHRLEPDMITLQKMQEKAHDNCFIANSLNAKIKINIQLL